MTRKDGAPGISRRGFVAGALGAAAVIAVGGAGALTAHADVLRPPGAQDETFFLASCIRCDRCRSACPEGAIALAKVEDGMALTRTPKMNFQRGWCTTCDGAYRCAVVCPTQGIAFGFDPATSKIGIARVDFDECLLYRGTSSKCSKQCISACPYDALAYENDQLRVDDEKCNGCGACEFACPSASYAASTTSGRRGINVETIGGAAA